MIIVARTEQPPDGTFGTMTLPGATGKSPLVLQTLEDDWMDNRRGKSCIPAGDYVLRRTIYYRHGYETFEVTNVPGRQRILIHPGNTEEDVEGCILVGLRRGVLLVPQDEDTGAANVEKRAVVASREAFRRFMERMVSVDEAHLRVVWAPGLPIAA